MIHNPESIPLRLKITDNQLSEEQMQLVNQIQSILKKSVEFRNIHDSQVIVKFIENSFFLSLIVELTQLEVAKNLMRYSNIHRIHKNRILTQKGNESDRMILLLDGKFGISDPQPETQTKSKDQQELEYKSMLHNAIHQSNSFLRSIKRKWKVVKDDPKFLAQFPTTQFNQFKEAITKQYQSSDVFDIKSLCMCTMVSESLVSCSEGRILSLSLKKFYEILANYVKKMKYEKIRFFRAFDCFNLIDKPRMVEVVAGLTCNTKQKGQIIYREGQPCKDIYVLMEGQIKVTKIVELFKENPNCLYANRVDVLGAPVLNYADFSQIYNYKPKRKLVQIGIISGCCLFGQEQIICNCNSREVSVQVCSQQASFYQIGLQYLQTMMTDKKSFIKQFKHLLQQQGTHKILYRQQKLAELLLQENEKHMDYFYLDDSSNTTSVRNEIKFKVNRVNNMISPVRPKTSKANPHAFYNTFNFADFNKKSPKVKNSSTRSYIQNSFNENKIIGLLHTCEVRRKSQKQNRQSINTEINVFNPLFSIQYLQRKSYLLRKMEKSSKESRIKSQKDRGSSYQRHSSLHN